MASASKACATLGVPFPSTNSELHARRRNTFFLHGPFKNGRRLIERAPTSRRLAPRSLYNQETRRTASEGVAPGRMGFRRGSVDEIGMHQAQGEFRGYSNQGVPQDYPRDGYLVIFELRPDVPLETILQLADAVQGLCTFQGCELQGELFYPDIYTMAKTSAESTSRPWTVFASALPEYPFVSFEWLTQTEEDAKRLEAAVLPLIEDINIYNRTASKPIMLA